MSVSPITITAALSTCFGVTDLNGYVTVTLTNFGTGLPCIPGQTVVSELTQTAYASGGNISFNVWPNSAIVSGGVSNTFYEIAVFGSDGSQVIKLAYLLNTSGDLSNISPLASTPAPVLPLPSNAVLTNPTGQQTISTYPLDLAGGLILGTPYWYGSVIGNSIGVLTSVGALPQSSLISGSQYCTSGFTSKGVNHCGQATSGSNVINITTGTMTVSAADIGKNVYVGGAFGGVYQTITGVNSSTQFTTANNASSSVSLAAIVIWEVNQDDTAAISASLSAGNFYQSGIYYGPRVYVYSQQFTVPPGVQGVFFGGQNNTFFIPKTVGQIGGCFYQPNAPSSFCIGGPAQGATIIGGGFVNFAVCSAATLSGNTLSVTVTNSKTLNTNTIIRLCGARSGANPLNDTQWLVQTANSSGFTATPVFWDDTNAGNTITNIAIDGSNNTTLTIGAHNWEVGYAFVPEGATTVTALNGVTMTVTAITSTTVTATGLVHATVSSTPETGTINHFGNQTWTDNFDAVHQYNGIRVISHSNPGQTIAHHLIIEGMNVGGFQGDSYSLQQPNYGYFTENTAFNSFGGCAMLNTYPTTGWSSNPSSYTINGGNELTGNAYGLYIRNAGGMTIGTFGCSGAGIGLILYDCPAAAFHSPDLEEQKPSSVDSTAWPGYGIEIRGSSGLVIDAPYLSSGTVDAYVVYIWDASRNCRVRNCRDFVSASGVHPTTEVYVDATCIDCGVDNFWFITTPTAGLQTGSYINLSQVTSSFNDGQYYFGAGTSGNVYLVNNQQATSGSTVHAAPSLVFQGTYWTGSASANDSYSIDQGVVTGSNGLSSLTITHTGSSGGSQISFNGAFLVGGGGQTTLINNTAATVSVPQSSPKLIIQGQSWNGTNSDGDGFQLQAVPGTGSNPVLTIALKHDANTSTGTSQFAYGSTGQFTVSSAGVITACTGITNTGALAMSSGQVISWNADTGISRDAAATFDFGNGTAGDKTGTINAATVSATNVTATGTLRANTGFSANGTAGVSVSGGAVTAITTITGIVTALTASSDERLKESIKPNTNGLDEILKVDPISFKWNAKGRKKSGFPKKHPRQYGFSAQNIKKAMPDAVGNEGEYLTVNQWAILGAAINAIKELTARIVELEKR